MKNYFRWVNKSNFGLFAAISVALLVICNLVSLLITAIEGYYTRDSIVEILSSAISLLFLVMVCNYFNRSRTNFYYAFHAILLILICEYILPFIMAFITVGLNLAILIPSVSIVLAIVYFIFMALENRKRLKIFNIVLMILGIIFGLYALGAGIFYIYLGVETLITFVSGSFSFLEIFSMIFSLISVVLSAVVYPLILCGYPFILKKERLY